MSTTVKLLLGVAIVVMTTAYMAYVGASTSWKYYLTAEECLAHPTRFVGQRMRVSGRVAAGSLSINERRTQARFDLVGPRRNLAVVCQGILPDNLTDNMDVVVEGTLEKDGLLQGDTVLTRCASKYAADEDAEDDAAESPSLAGGTP